MIRLLEEVRQQTVRSKQNVSLSDIKVLVLPVTATVETLKYNTATRRLATVLYKTVS